MTNMTVSKGLSLERAALRVTWNIPQSDVAVSQYQVQYRRNGSNTFWRSADHVSSGSTTSTLLVQLRVGTIYWVRIRAVSAIGNGTWSRVESETTYMSELSTII